MRYQPVNYQRRPPVRPNDRPGPLGANPIGGTPSTVRQAFTQAQVNASLAANPHAAGAAGTPFAYQGQAGVMPEAAGVNGNAQKTPVSSSFEEDPILAKIRALATTNIGNAESGALAARQQELIGYGYDPTMQDQYTDPSNAAAAQQNPFSILSQLARQHTSRAHNLDEQLNQGNLFYSGTRGTELGNEARTYLGEQAGANATVRSHLGAIATSLLAARHAEEERVLQAEGDAYQRYLQFHEQYGIPAAPGDTPATAASATTSPFGATPTTMANQGYTFATQHAPAKKTARPKPSVYRGPH